MKGFAKVQRSDLMSAIIGFEMRLDEALKIRNKGIDLYYAKNYPKLNPISRWLKRGISKYDFARERIGLFGSWSEVLYTVLTTDETNEVHWWGYRLKSDADPIRALYKATSEDHVLVDQDMANFIVYHKNYLEGLK